MSAKQTRFEQTAEPRMASPNGAIRKVALLGNHLPRQCGIATFTSDLCDAVGALDPGLECFVLAMNDGERRHAYPSRVRFEIADGHIDSYRRAADFLNVNAIDVLCVQHEYGIFGGRAGAHVLALLRELRMPIVTTLHTILEEPSLDQCAVMDELVALSDRLIVMSEHGVSLLRDVHGVPASKIDLVPHGIPHVVPNPRAKDQLGVAGKSVILTFGLLSPDKGIETVIDALPAILERHPDTVYVVLGATHPHVKERDGETYRLMLEDRAHRLGVDANMIFHNRFVSPEELSQFVSAADLYVTPYLKAEQITSGTLAFAVGAGKAVISTPYWHARELLDKDRGVLVPWRDSAAIARAAIDLLGDERQRHALQRRARAHGRTMHWPAVAFRYVESFERAHREHSDRRRTAFEASTLARRPAELPDIDLRHLRVLTDDTGLLQHAAFSVPRYADGYCTDDNARALLVMALIEDAEPSASPELRTLASRYLAFVHHAFNPDRLRFRNFMTYERRWLEECGSEDSHGRALWALGAVVGRARDPGRQSLAGELFHAALPAATELTSPRAWAFALLGVDEYLRSFGGDSRVEAVRSALAQRLFALFEHASSPKWPWFEPRATYCNAQLSQALLVSGARMQRDDLLKAGLRSLQWLCDIQSSPNGHFTPIGTEGFYERGHPMAAFDQQPVEASAMVSACLEAHRLTNEKSWMESARSAFRWFFGENVLHASLFDPQTGGCRDGLHADRVNANQGAESTLAFLIALLEMRGAGNLRAPAPRALASRIP